MPTQTFQSGSFNNGQVVIEYDINDANWRVSQIRCINNSDQPAIGYVYLDGELIFEAIAPPNQTTSWNTSGIQLGWQDDYWNDLTQQWEAGGIEMGGYVFQASWPWGT